MSTNLNLNENATQEVAASRMARVNYLADVQYTALSADYHKSIKKILRTTGVDDAMVCQEIIDPRRLAHIERDVFADYDGVYLTYTVEATKEGLEEIHCVLVQGKTFDNPRFTPGLVKAGYGNTRFYVGLLTAGEGRVTFYMTPRKQDLRLALGIFKAGKDLIKDNKRERRTLANGELTLRGTIVSQSDKEHPENWNVRLGSGLDQGVIPMDVYHIRFDRAFCRATPLEVRQSYTARIGVLRINPDDFLHLKVLGITDGAHALDTGNINLWMAAMGLDYQVAKGDGAQFTINGRFKHGKGNAVCAFLADLDILILDTKKEFGFQGDNVRLSLNFMHQSGPVCTDVQSFVNGLFEEINLLEDAGQYWVGSIKEAIGDDAKMREILNTRWEDSISGDDQWVLKNFLKLTRKSMLDSYGQQLSIWHFPGLAKKALRFLTEQLMDITRMRVPLPRHWAAAGYAMFDISILEHADKLLSGRGFYLESAALPSCTAALQVATDIGYGVTFSELWEGETVLHRQPNGYGREWPRGVQLVKAGFYAEMRTSPFLFMSCLPLDFSQENTQLYAEMMLGKEKFAELTKLWGEQIPSIVYWLAVMGGGDLDDRVIAYLDSKIVNHLNNVEQRLFDYPEGNFTTVEEFKQSAKQHSDILQNRLQQLAGTMTPIFNMIKMTAGKAGLIGRISNVAMIFNTLYYAGKLGHIDTGIAAFIKRLEQVVDNDKMGKGTSMVVEATKAIDRFYMEVSLQEVPAYLAARLPRKYREQVGTYVSKTDRQLDALQQSVEELKEAVLEAYVSRKNTQILDVLYGCPVSGAAIKAAAELRAEFKMILTRERAAIAGIYLDSRFENVSENDKEMMVTVQTLSTADATITNLVKEYPVRIQSEIAIALYKNIVEKEFRDPETGEVAPIADGMLFGSQFHHIFLAAVEYAYDFSNGLIPPPAPEPEEVVSEETAPATNVFTVVNGMSKKSEAEVAVFQAQAETNQPVYLAPYLATNTQDMEELGILVPELRGRNQDVVVVRLYSDHSIYGYIAAAELPAFFQYWLPEGGTPMGHLIVNSHYAASVVLSN